MGDSARAKWAAEKWGRTAVPVFVGGGKLDPSLTQCGLGRGLPSYQVAS